MFSSVLRFALLFGVIFSSFSTGVFALTGDLQTSKNEPTLGLLDPFYFQKNIKAATSEDSIGIEIYDASVGTPEVVDEITLQAQNTLTKEKVTITLKETDRESSVFRGTLQVVKDTAKNAPNNLFARNRDTVVFTYKKLSKSLPIIGKAQIQLSPTRLYFHLQNGADVDTPNAKDIIEILPGKTYQKNLIITNVGDEEAYYVFSFEDFYKDRFDNIVYYTDKTAPSELQGITLSKWLSVPGPKRIFLKPKETKTLALELSLPEGMPSGGMYGAFIIKQDVDPALQTSETLLTNQEYSILLAANIGSKGDIVLTGNAQNLSIYNSNDPKSPASFFYGTTSSLPIGVRFDFINTGNAAFKPQGNIQIKNVFGGKSIEEDLSFPSSAFPKITKTYEQLFTKNERFWFGPYKVTLELKGSDSNILSEQSKWVWIFDIYGIIGTLSIISILVFVGIFFVGKIKPQAKKLKR